MQWKTTALDDGNKLTLPDGWLPPQYYDALNVLFRVENALRVFVYIVLKNAHGAKWNTLSITSDDNRPGTIATVARQRQEQDRKYGYLGQPITSPLMYLTSGELVRLMFTDDQWPHFSRHFLTTKSLIQVKLEEIGNIRNALAHFRLLTSEDVELVKYNAKHVLAQVERCLEEVLGATLNVPSNSQAEWYKRINLLPSVPCTLSVKQSLSEEWIAVHLIYPCPIVRPSLVGGGYYMRFGVLTLQTSSIARAFAGLSDNVTYIAEGVERARVEDNGDARFGKRIILLFGRAALERALGDVVAALEKAISTISDETAMITQENSARGEIVRMVTVTANKVPLGNGHYWRPDTTALKCSVASDDPPEYWGGLGRIMGTDWISGAKEYPWMPMDIGMVATDDISF